MRPGNSDSAEPRERSPKNATVLWLALVLLAVLLGIRFIHLAADPPMEFADFGNAVITDPYFYTAYARNDALYGHWDPYHEHRFTMFQYSLVSVAARVVFGLGGVSRVTANLAAVLLHLFGIFFFLWAIYDRERPALTVITALFLLGNILSFFYSRYPLLENGLLFLVGVTCLAFFKLRHPTARAIVTGALIALAALTGKLFGYLLLGPVIVVLVAEYRRQAVRPILVSLASTALVSVGYLFLVGGGSLQPYFDYLGDVKTTTNSLIGLTSAYHYAAAFLTYVMQTRIPEFFGILIPAALAGWLFSTSDNWDDAPSALRLSLFAITWILLTMVALAPADYRPARYTMMLYLPLAYLAAECCYR
ncbi:MAG: hypothetical protein D6800_11720, partial [Candidatus Zixiibacteriota bacterium]